MRYEKVEDPARALMNLKSMNLQSAGLSAVFERIAEISRGFVFVLGSDAGREEEAALEF
jgi:hypothetical protein